MYSKRDANINMFIYEAEGGAESGARRTRNKYSRVKHSRDDLSRVIKYIQYLDLLYSVYAVYCTLCTVLVLSCRSLNRYRHLALTFEDEMKINVKREKELRGRREEKKRAEDWKAMK